MIFSENRFPLFGIMLYFPGENSQLNDPTKTAPHQFERNPIGFVTGSITPPGAAFGSPVKTKQFSFVRFVLE
jgi:hypothetical protein